MCNYVLYAAIPILQSRVFGCDVIGNFNSNTRFSALRDNCEILICYNNILRSVGDGSGLSTFAIVLNVSMNIVTLYNHFVISCSSVNNPLRLVRNVIIQIKRSSTINTRHSEFYFLNSNFHVVLRSSTSSKLVISSYSLQIKLGKSMTEIKMNRCINSRLLEI